MSQRFDREDQVADSQVFPAAATVSTDSLKKPAAQDLAYGHLPFVLAVFAQGNTGAATSWLVEAIQADNAALTTNVQVLASATYTAAELVAGKAYEIAIPKGKMSKEYIGARCTATGGTTPTFTASMYYAEGGITAPYKSFPKQVDAAV